MADPVGLAASIVALIQTAKAIYNLVERLHMNGPKRSHLLKRVNGLIEVLRSAGRTSEGAVELVESSLQEVKATLESLVEPRKMERFLNLLKGCVTAEPKEAKLEEAERKLDALMTQVVVVEKFLQLRKDIPRIYNERMELPKSAGHTLEERAKPVLKFLEESRSQELRVVGIHGLPGVGKTTLLNYIWQEASSKAPFSASAHVQIGSHNITPQLLCSLQSSILRQLDGGQAEFTSLEGGKEKLRQHFCQLRDCQKCVFLAIDNIFDANNLQSVLPFDVRADLLPAGSCIVITCRDLKVVETLLNICSLHRENDSQVFCYAPKCLNLEESTAVFVQCGGLDKDENAELLMNLVPLCKGLPLALTVLGKTFAGKGLVGREEWEKIKERMEAVDEDEPTTAAVKKSLHLSYDLLGERSQAAFSDVVNFYYGWPWQRVARILDEHVLTALKNSALVSEAEGWEACNQSALKKGYDWPVCEGDEDSKVVMTHDLILHFGECLQKRSRVVMATTMEALLLKADPPRLIRNLLLLSPDVRRTAHDAALLEFLEKTGSLQMLQLGASVHPRYVWIGRLSEHDTDTDPKEECFKADLDADGRRRASIVPLRYLVLTGYERSRHITEIKVSREIREIHLCDCSDVEHLPDTPLKQLECLRISICCKFQGFSSACVKSWRKLKYLEVSKCDRITSIPAELGRLESLRSVVLRSCSSLRDFPALCNNAQGPSHLKIENCPSLRVLSTLSCPLRALHLRDLPATHLPIEESACEHLQLLSVRACLFEVLPPAIYENTCSLQHLTFSSCPSLVELPDDVGRLTSLTGLDFSWCKNLRALPPAIGNLSSLEILNLNGCESLEELPDEAVGRLTSLTWLNISGCKKLRALPPAIGNLSSLQELDLSGCESLEELPDEAVGKLTSLTWLNISRCKKLRALPPAIGNLSSLQELDLGGCESLEELPDEAVGRLTSLTWLNIFGCKNLRALPPAIRNLSSLQELDLGGCESLEQLPDEAVRRLTSLTWLNISRCKNLRALPPAIGNLSSLRTSYFGGCESLEELPDEVKSLTGLRICGWKDRRQGRQPVGRALSH